MVSPPIERSAGDAPGSDVRLTLHEGRLGGPVVARFSFPRDAPELEQLRVGAVVELKGQRWRVLDSLVGGASGFIVIERIR